MLTPSILAGTASRKTVSKELMGAVGAIGLAVAMVNSVGARSVIRFCCWDI